jgi:hypothetical protein
MAGLLRSARKAAALRRRPGEKRIIEAARNAEAAQRQQSTYARPFAAMSRQKTITVYGPAARAIDDLARACPTHSVHRIGVAAMRVGLRVLAGNPDLLERELVAMAREPRTPEEP